MNTRKNVISILAVVLCLNVVLWAEQTEKPDSKDRITTVEKSVPPAAVESTVYKPRPRASLSGLESGIALEDAIDIFRHSTNPPLNIVVLWNQLALANIERYSEVTFDAMSGVSLKTNLELTLMSISRAQDNIDFWVKDGIIIIGLADQKPAERVTRIYNVTDITSPPSTGQLTMQGMGNNFGNQNGLNQPGQNNGLGQGNALGQGNNNFGQTNSSGNSSYLTNRSSSRSYRKALPTRQVGRTSRKKTSSRSKATTQKIRPQFLAYGSSMSSGIGNIGTSAGLNSGGMGMGGIGMGGMGMGGMGMGGMGMGGMGGAGMLATVQPRITQNQQALKSLIEDTIEPDSWNRNNNNNQNNNIAN